MPFQNRNELSKYISLHDESTNQSRQHTKSLTVLFCVDLGKFSFPSQFFVCSVGVFVFYVAYGFFQELIFQLDGFKPYGFYLTLVQFSIYSCLAYGECLAKKETVRRAPFFTHVLVSLLTVGTMGFSNASLGYLNYPTQVVFKCCKLIPVLLGGIVIQGKNHSCLDFFAALLMSIGLTLFILTDNQVSPKFTIVGIIFITFALLMDAMIGNVQEKAMKQYKASNVEIVFYSYSLGVLILLIILVCAGQLYPAFLFCLEHPLETYGYGTLFTLSGYCGLQMVLSLIQISGAFTAVTVTTCRKAVTIILSFLLFSKPFSFQYVWSGFIVLFGIYLNTYNKQMKKSPEKILPTTRENVTNL